MDPLDVKNLTLVCIIKHGFSWPKTLKGTLNSNVGKGFCLNDIVFLHCQTLSATLPDFLIYMR